MTGAVLQLVANSSAVQNIWINKDPQITFYKKVFQDDYMDILDIRKKGENVTDADISDMNDIVEKISKDEEEYDKAFHKAQKDFAEKNNMKLKENEMQKDIDDATKEWNGVCQSWACRRLGNNLHAKLNQHTIRRFWMQKTDHFIICAFYRLFI